MGEVQEQAWAWSGSLIGDVQPGAGPRGRAERTAARRFAGGLLGDRRAAAGWSVDELSRFTTISASRLRSLESGGGRWRADELNELARILDFDAGQFLEQVIRHLENRKSARAANGGGAPVLSDSVPKKEIDAELARQQQAARRHQHEARRQEQRERRRRRDRTRRLIQHACELNDAEWQQALAAILASRAATDNDLRLAILDAAQLLAEHGLKHPGPRAL